jgi:hypothetical protein
MFLLGGLRFHRSAENSPYVAATGTAKLLQLLQKKA